MMSFVKIQKQIWLSFRMQVRMVTFFVDKNYLMFRRGLINQKCRNQAALKCKPSKYLITRS